MGLLEKLTRLGRRASDRGDDQALLALIREDPATGWRSFLDRYSGHMLAWIRDLGFDHDESMERFVFVCEKLAEHQCRRLRQVRRLGDQGELVPWLRQVVRNLLVSWMWSEDGRPRLLKAIENLSTIEQEVFRLHFWEGLPASEILAHLRARGEELSVVEIYLALDTVQGALSAAKRWRLVSRLSSRKKPLSLAGQGDGPSFEPASNDRDPERIVLALEAQDQLRLALYSLSHRERLMVKLRFDESLETREIAELLDETPDAVRRQLRRSLSRLRQDLSHEPRSRTA